MTEYTAIIIHLSVYWIPKSIVSNQMPALEVYKLIFQYKGLTSTYISQKCWTCAQGHGRAQAAHSLRGLGGGAVEGASV